MDEIASHANLPHYKIVGNIDGVALKKNSEMPEAIPKTLLTLIQNTLPTRYPFVVDIYHGKGKPPA